MEPPPETIEIPEFRLLGIAEKVPEIGISSESAVFVWHVETGIVPISGADFERWCVDAPIFAELIKSNAPASRPIIPDPSCCKGSASLRGTIFP